MSFGAGAGVRREARRQRQICSRGHVRARQGRRGGHQVSALAYVCRRRMLRTQTVVALVISLLLLRTSFQLRINTYYSMIVRWARKGGWGTLYYY